MKGSFKLFKSDKEYHKFLDKVRDVGHLSKLTRRISFVAFTDESNHDWLEIVWGEGRLRLDIYDDKLHINCYPLILHQDAMNAITITMKEIEEE